MRDFSIDTDTIRVFFHLLGVAVWVGGQIVVGFLIPALRKIGVDAPQRVAQRFNTIAWPFFGLAVFTGIWGLGENFDEYTTGGKVGLFVKLGIVTLSGILAWLHTNETKSMRKRIYAAGALIMALAAMLFGLALSS